MINKVYKYFSRRIFPALRTKVWPLNIQGQFGKHWKAEANHEQTSITSELMTRGDACSDFFFSLFHCDMMFCQCFGTVTKIAIKRPKCIRQVFNK